MVFISNFNRPAIENLEHTWTHECAPFQFSLGKNSKTKFRDDSSFHFDNIVRHREPRADGLALACSKCHLVITLIVTNRLSLDC